MTRTLTRGGPAIELALLPLLCWPIESDWPQSLYLPGIEVPASRARL
jgi:hypothetical protein